MRQAIAVPVYMELAPHRTVLKLLAPERRMTTPEGDQILEKAKKITLRPGSAPIYPGQLIVLAIGIIVPLLGASDFVAVEKHGNTVESINSAARLRI